MSGIDANRVVGMDPSMTKHLICGICQLIVNNAVSSHCGHIFCRSCTEQLIQSSPTTKCPICRQSLSIRKRSATGGDGMAVKIGRYWWERNLAVNGLVGDLKVKCDHQLNGCPAVVLWSSMADHLTNCPFKKCKTCGQELSKSGQQSVDELRAERDDYKRQCLDLKRQLDELRDTSSDSDYEG